MYSEASQTPDDGVEIPITMMLSDIRGSTTVAERMRPADIHTFLNRFDRLASDSIVAHDGIVHKVMGDEVIGLFFAGISGPRHPAAAVAAAIDLADQAARASAPLVSTPVGTAVRTGGAFVGATGLGTTVDAFTALGDAVNITTRFASPGVAGEVIASVAAAKAAGNSDRRTRTTNRGRSVAHRSDRDVRSPRG